MKEDHRTALTKWRAPSPYVLSLPVAYFVTASIPVHFFGVNSPIWYANAIALVALLRRPRRDWLALLTIMWLADTAALYIFGSGPAPLLAACDVVEVGLAAQLIASTGGLPSPLFNGAQLARMAAVCLVVPLLSSALGAGLLFAREGLPFLPEWGTWYLATALGLLLVTPFLASWTDERVRSRELQGASWHQFAIGSVTAAIAVSVVFSLNSPSALFVCFPLMMIITWRLGLLGSTSAAVVTALIATVATLEGAGPIAAWSSGSGGDVGKVQNLQLYLTCLLFSSLPLAALFSHLRDLAESRTAFLAAMSHEIRTPMTAVLGMTELLKQEDLPPHVRGFVNSIRVSGQHLLNIINDILDLSRLQAGRLELEQVAFSLRDVVEQVRSMTMPSAIERGLDLRFEIGADLPVNVLGDPTRLRQVLLNLVGNALKFTHQGSVLTSIASAGASEMDGATNVRFEVRDTGIGIATEHQQEIFGAFAQADSSTSRRFGGSGLGLAISRQIVRAMGGDITLHSSVGGGSTFAFEVLLPRAEPTRQDAPGDGSRAAVSSLTVLVVDDVEVNRELLSEVLTRAGNKVAVAVDGQDAIEKVRAQRFDVVLMDIQMPVMDGVEATRRIRRLGEGRGAVPIVGLTANVMLQDQNRYLAAGMNACLTKPIVWDELWAALGQFGTATVEQASSPGAAAHHAAPVLVDVHVVDNLRKLVPDVALQKLLAGAMQTGRHCVTGLSAHLDRAELAARTHKLKGTAGTFGLLKLAAVAAEVDEAVRQETDVEPLIHELRRALGDTSAELRRLGFDCGELAQ